MPLPIEDEAWPPTSHHVQEKLADWDAWWSSEPHRLFERYFERGVRDLPDIRQHAWQHRGGVVGRVARWFWGNPTPPGEKVSKLHVPLAGDIARTSSDLLFSEPPKLTSDHAATQERLDDLVDDGLHPALLEAAEVCAALGGVYLRVVWDTDVADRPWIASVAADCAVPEFAYGRLKAVTFWTVVERDGNVIWRHLERHERGVILHGLYRGTPGMLGNRMNLLDHEATAPLAAELTDQDTIETGAPDHLTAVYIPNMRPARAWRHDPKAAYLGQSDFQGIEPLMDALDETYSSWMRDIDLGKGRVIVPASMLDSAGPGHGAIWNEDRKIFTPINSLQRPGDSGQLEVVQFQIRYEEHRATANELMEQAVRQAGYSGASFGLQGDGSAITATEIRARERRSMTTRARKALYWCPGVSDIVAALLAVESGPLFGVSGLDLEPPTVEFQDSISDSPAEIAQTATLLRGAEAASTDVLVRMVHPDWDDAQVAEEVAAVRSEYAPEPLADPAALGAGGEGLDQPAQLAPPQHKPETAPTLSPPSKGY